MEEINKNFWVLELNHKINYLIDKGTKESNSTSAKYTKSIAYHVHNLALIMKVIDLFIKLI